MNIILFNYLFRNGDIYNSIFSNGTETRGKQKVDTEKTFYGKSGKMIKAMDLNRKNYNADNFLLKLSGPVKD